MFNRLLESSNCQTDSEVLALIIYYLHEYQSAEEPTHKDIEDMIASYEIQLNNETAKTFPSEPARGIFEPLENLRYRELLIEDVGYRLTDSGYDFVTQRLDGPVPPQDRPTGNFIQLEVDDNHYSDAIQEVNLCYQSGAYTATLVMFRRVIESLLIDINHLHFGGKELERYYDEGSGRHKRLGIQNKRV